jgi:hypothetical protein
MKQGLWLSKPLPFLPFHALFEPMATILGLPTESPLKTEHPAETWQANGGRTEDWAVEGPADEIEHYYCLKDDE